MLRCFFFFNDTATTEIYTLSLHDALPIFAPPAFLCCLHDTRLESAHIAMNFGPVDGMPARRFVGSCTSSTSVVSVVVDRKSTRLNSSHANISYAVFCLKKKKRNSCAISCS